MIKRNHTNGELLYLGGVFTAAFSAVVGAIILFATPIACTFVGSLQLLILGFLFLIGVSALLIGVAMSRKSKKTRVASVPG